MMDLNQLTDPAFANDYFGFQVPVSFSHFLKTTFDFAEKESISTEMLLTELFDLLRLEGAQARYQQTPPEFFPIGSNGIDGEHFGFMVHENDGSEYPGSFFCPMDSDGALFLGKNTTEMLQNMTAQGPNNYQPLLEQLGINTALSQSPYTFSNPVVRPVPAAKPGWRWLETSDGAGVFAPEAYFQPSHTTLEAALALTESPVQYFMELADACKSSGHYAASLYYAKEAYWLDWTNPDTARTTLTLMIDLYTGLERPHLRNVAENMRDSIKRPI